MCQIPQFEYIHVPIFYSIKPLLLIIYDHLLYLQCGEHYYGSHIEPNNN